MTGPWSAAAVRLEGFHAVKHALRFAPELVDEVVARNPDAALRLAGELAPDVAGALRSRMRAGAADHPTGVVGTARRPDQALPRNGRRVLLDAPRHAGNTGAVVRVAAAAGAAAVLTTGEQDPWHAAVLRGSAGLHFALPVLRIDAADVDGPLVLLDAGAPDVRTASVPADAVLVFGSERRGISAALRSRADLVVGLPMRSGVSSLNLATAVAATLYALR